MSSWYSSIIKDSAQRIVYVLGFVFYEIWWYDSTGMDDDDTGEVVEYEWNYLFRDDDGQIENRSIDVETVEEYIALAKELGTPALVWRNENI